MSRTLVFNIPRDVYRHLGMRTHPLKQPGPLGTDDQFAWAMPAHEYYAMRRSRPVENPHGLLVNARVEGILPGPAELERRRGRARA